MDGADAFECTSLSLRINLVTSVWDSKLSYPVCELVASSIRQAKVEPSRVQTLVQALGLVPLLGSELSAVSDGQRWRVQLFCQLLPRRELILLDEATNSLDVLSRSELLTFLMAESERGATVIFCTHIFDGLDGWATDVLHLQAFSCNSGRLLRLLRDT